VSPLNQPGQVAKDPRRDPARPAAVDFVVGFAQYQVRNSGADPALAGFYGFPEVYGSQALRFGNSTVRG
jgi:hypothetical protein